MSLKRVCEVMRFQKSLSHIRETDGEQAEKNTNNSIISSLQLSFTLSVRLLRISIRPNLLGPIWWFLEPLIFATLLNIIFVQIRSNDANLFPQLLIAMNSWKWFSSSIVSMTNGISQNISIMSKSRVAKWIFPLSISIVNTIKFYITNFIFILFLVTFWDLNSKIIFLLLIITPIQFMIQTSIGLFLSSINPIIPDISKAVQSLMIIIFATSGVLTTDENLGDYAESIFNYNPIYAQIKLIKSIIANKELMLNYPPYWPIISIIIAVISLAIIKYMDGRYAKIY